MSNEISNLMLAFLMIFVKSLTGFFFPSVDIMDHSLKKESFCSRAAPFYLSCPQDTGNTVNIYGCTVMVNK